MFFFGISKYVISKRFTINLYFIYLAQYVWSVQLPVFSGKVDKSTYYLILIDLILTIVLYTLKTSVLYTVIIILI